MYIIGWGLVCFALGFVFGDRQGFMRGENCGALRAPLAMRQEALCRGHCPACDAVHIATNNSDNEEVRICT
ncbi:MAG: hypothetical protein KGZ92_09025 [Firmicutes bacterium]|nr:hypothetical protein [Dethiobacter sp.]MBS3889404.1 hypothetical protein [Bacillota bacterium]MBS4054521.1 hypothetical protein [Thermaerobacter sp.]